MATEVRRKSLVFPREHGAWGMLLVPLITGALVGLVDGGNGWPLAPLTIAVLALFWLRTPVESWMGAAPVKARNERELALVRKAALALTAVAAGALAWLFGGGSHLSLLWIGAAAGAAFCAQAMVKQIGRSGRTAAQMIGAAGLTATAPAAYYVVTGHIDGVAWALWLANLAFAANQIQFVQLRIRSARALTAAERLAAGRAFLVAQGALVIALAVACAARFFGWLAAMAFAPILARGFAWFLSSGEPLAIHRLGKRELAYAVMFGVLLVAGFAM